ncbi:MAG: tyrosine-type recombinase/integrase [Rhodomicrobium sp.]
MKSASVFRQPHIWRQWRKPQPKIKPVTLAKSFTAREAAEQARSDVQAQLSNARAWVFVLSTRLQQEISARQLAEMARIRAESEIQTAKDATVKAQAEARSAIALCYGCGLRAGETCRLKGGDIDSELNIIRVVQAKGRKDRHVMLPPEVLDLLRQWWKARPSSGQ